MIPYQHLFIYEISGEVFGSRDFFKNDFIGCWNEGESSFFFFSHPHDEEVLTFVNQKKLSLLSKNVFDYRDSQVEEELKPFRVGNLVVCPPWENERRLNLRSIQTYQKIQEKKWQTLVGLKKDYKDS